MTDLTTTLLDLTRRLAAAGVPEARRDARLLLAEALAVETSWLFNHPDHPLDAAAGERLAALARRRCRREPMSHILGRREFWSLSFEVTKDTLAPRPDSETLIEALLAEVPERQAPLTLLDLGTGTGCLLLAMLGELPRAEGLGVDRDAATLAVAEANADRLGFGPRSRFLQSDWYERVAGRFDLIVANPPYIATSEIDRLEPEVALYEPRRALDGGADGLDAYRILAVRSADHLRPGGLLALEIGFGQADAVTALVQGAGLTIRAIRSDLAGIPRCVVAGL